MASPSAIGVSTCFFRSSDAEMMIGIDPSLFTPGIRLELTQARAISSTTMFVEIASAPMPPYSSGMCGALKPVFTSSW